MLDLNTPIIPYKGTGIFQLNANYEEVKHLLKVNNIVYEEEIWNKTDPDHLWNVIVITKKDSNSQHSAIELFFAKDRLFKIGLCEDFEGSLPNGIHTGMSIKDAWKIDKKLHQDDDFDEVYISPNGYFLEYSNRNLEIMIITIFISAVERDDFFEYNW